MMLQLRLVEVVVTRKQFLGSHHDGLDLDSVASVVVVVTILADIVPIVEVYSLNFCHRVVVLEACTRFLPPHYRAAGSAV
jgi:hypothetical protein